MSCVRCGKSFRLRSLANPLTSSWRVSSHTTYRLQTMHSIIGWCFTAESLMFRNRRSRLNAFTRRFSSRQTFFFSILFSRAISGLSIARIPAVSHPPIEQQSGESIDGTDWHRYFLGLTFHAQGHMDPPTQDGSNLSLSGSRSLLKQLRPKGTSKDLLAQSKRDSSDSSSEDERVSWTLESGRYHRW